ncbi:twin-arginine translocation signal domain-containing protein, partial [Amycolatopsis sp. NPDC000673]|uniref:twin-arginine translocation signal domain-containing protein n=1 Tax=Amycolatopsis sp. NPDC000673 TaxID=3154267 RepID=UPI003319514F
MERRTFLRGSAAAGAAMGATSAAAVPAGAALAEIRRQVPDAALSFLDASSTEQLRMLSEGR